PARGRWEVTVEVTATAPGAPVAAPPTRELWRPPAVGAGDHRLPALVERAVADLGGLLAADPLAPDDHYLAAGAPWYLTLFGRDSIWAARMALPLGTELAAGTLRTLARRQGTRTDAGTEQAPGKILHEVRVGRSGVEVYYGTVDATPLWVSLLHDAWRWGLPPAEVRALRPNLEAALGWLRDSAAAGDGLVRYVDRAGRLANQGWKDSGDSVQFADGRLAEPPIALCEVQAYAYEAAVQGAALLDATGGDGRPWRDWAAALAGRFRDRFWIEDAAGRYPAIALDGDGRPVDSVTSNIGHLLGTGLLDAAETAEVVARLAAPDLDCGVGLRTMSTRSAGFNPLSYHGGSVWAHDTAIALRGLAAVGTAPALETAGSYVRGLLAAGAAFDFRLPELYGGEATGDGRLPLPYPAACRPQAWSAAAALVVLTATLGLAPDVPAGRLALRPLRPSPVGELTVRGLRVAGEPLDVRLTATGELDVLTAPASLTIESR
ncbi:MAG TPA: amylo-alpha-1,6-glucosidase, partial [Mycobacteriales bacterium]|nr:amylo-alpha-1,6-glucosidase [Mycobacteriales bacterium]